MDNYKELYLNLFRGVSRAIAALDRNEPSLARVLLIQAQQAAEDAFLQQVSEESE